MSWYWWLLIAAGIVALLFYLLVFPGPAEPDYRGDQLGSPAGEPAWDDDVWTPGHPSYGYGSPDEWDDLDADTQAEQLISEWHAPDLERTAWVEDHVGAWLDDPDLIVWDAKQQAARCWEILHIEFPRLRAELGIAA